MQDIGHDPKRPDTRVYATALAQPWHTDAADIVGALHSVLRTTFHSSCSTLHSPAI